MSIAARFKSAVVARSPLTSPTRERAPSIWPGRPISSDFTRATRDSRGVLARLQLHEMQERECGRPTLGSSERGEHRSTATDAGSAGRAAKQWN
jgi:hypothetical protein